MLEGPQDGAKHHSEGTTLSALEPGQALGPYRIERLLGEGAMGEAFLARHEEHRMPAVIKVLHPHLARKSAVLTRFRREGMALARVRHRHVVQVFDVTSFGGVECIVMEYLQGASLGDYLKRHGPLSVERIADLMVPVIEGVAAIHAAGIVHRDLKPENIFVSHDPSGELVPKVMDLGVARIESESDAAQTATAAVLGSPAYMSPEQARSTKTATALSDQYSLGVVLYEACTGVRPFNGDGIVGVLQAVIAGRFSPPGQLRSELSAAFEEVVLRAMAYAPSGRFADVRSLGLALLPFASEETQHRWGSTLSMPLVPPARGASGSLSEMLRRNAADTDTIAVGFSDDDVSDVPDAFAGTALAPPQIAASDRPDSLGASTSIISPSAPRRLPRVAFVSAVLLIAGLFSLASSGLFSGRSIPSNASLSTVTLALSSSPRDAEFVLDGVPIGVGRIDRGFVPDGREHVLLVRAPGYTPRVMTFRDAPPGGAVTLIALPVAPSQPDDTPRQSSNTRERPGTKNNPPEPHVERRPRSAKEPVRLRYRSGASGAPLPLSSALTTLR